MRTAALFLSLVLTCSAFADAVEEVRQAEIGFAKAFADRDKEKFFAFVAPDAVFMTALSTLRGKDQVVQRWSRFFEAPAAPFSWGPERVEITSSGTIGFSMGPIYGADGEHGGYYSSIWQKQADGSWKVVVDGPGAPGAPVPPNQAPFEEGFVTAADGVKLHFRKIGAGPITLIVPLGSVLYKPMMQFADIATVITYDVRNRGRSSRVDDPKLLTIQHDVSDLEAVRQHFKVEKFVPVGFSYLGKMVVMYAAAHPERVARLIQIGPLLRGVTGERTVEEDFGVPAENEERWKQARAAGAIEKTPKEACDALWGVMSYYLVGNPANAARLENLCALENEWPVHGNRHYAAHGPTVQAAVVTDADLKRVAMPVLTIHGRKDRNAPFSDGREWATILPNARLVTVDGAAHAAWADDPVTVFGSMRRFLRGDWPLGAVE